MFGNIYESGGEYMFFDVFGGCGGIDMLGRWFNVY